MTKVLSALFCVLFFCISCSESKYEKPDKSLNIALTAKVSSLDPIHSFDNVSGMIIYNICEQLFEYHYLNRPYEVQPLLADGMPKIENNGKRYIIKIKKNIQYHDHPAFKGEKRFLKADDFITTFKRLAYKPNKSVGWWLADGLIVGINDFREKVGEDFNKFKSTPISGIRAVDDYTLIIDIIQPSPHFLYKLALSFFTPLPIEVLDGFESHLATNPVGTGPFILDLNEPLKEVKLSKNPNYHEMYFPTEGDRYANSRGYLKDTGERIPFLDKVHFQVIQNNQTRWDMFNNYKLDYIVLPRDFYSKVFDDVGNLKEDIKSKNMRLQTMPTLTFWWLSFNMSDPILGKNVNLRKAIAHAIDMDKYIRDFTANTGQKANSLLPPGIYGYDPSATLPYSYNLALAKDFLAKAGFPEGKGLQPIKYDTRSESKISLDQADFFKEQLAQIGIKLEIIENNFSQYLEKSRTGGLQLFQDGWTLDYPDAENVLQILVSTNTPPGVNVTHYKNPRYDVLYDKMSKLPEGKEKIDLINEMEKIVHNDMPWIIQYYSRNFILHHDYLKNYRPSDLIFNYPKYIKVK